MPGDAPYLVAVIAAALVLFYTQWVRSDLTALLVTLSLILPFKATAAGRVGVLAPEEAFAAFGSTAVIMVVSLFVISAGMVRTGTAEFIGRRLLERAAGNELTLQATVLTSVTLFSSIINDTAAVLVWMPVVASVCNERGLNPARYLLAVAYGSLLGGQWTLIGTRSNVIISDYLRGQDGVGLGFFEFTPIAIPIFLACLAFYLLVGVRFLPRSAPEESLAEAYAVNDFLTEVMITPNSSVLGQRLDTAGVKAAFGVEVLEVIRGESRLPAAAGVEFMDADVLIVQGPSARIARLLKAPDFRLRAELEIAEGTLRSIDLILVETLITSNSGHLGRTLAEVDFLGRYGFSVLAVSRAGSAVELRPAEEPLRFGDTLLLCGHYSQLDRLQQNQDILPLHSRPMPIVDRRRSLIMLALVAGMALAAATGFLRANIALPVAAVATVLSGCLRMREVYSSVNWMAVVVVGGMLPYGFALEKTGTAVHLASLLAESLPGASRLLALGVLYAVAILATQILENAAVAIILVPLFYRFAIESHIAPGPVLLGLAITVSAAFLSPWAHESTVLVMGPGRYHFRDYLKVGSGFAFSTWLITVIAIALCYGLTP